MRAGEFTEHCLKCGATSSGYTASKEDWSAGNCVFCGGQMEGFLILREED